MIQDTTAPHEVVVWIDHARAIIVEHDNSGQSVQVVDRLLAEREERFEARAINEVLDRDRVIVSGPAYARTGFERAYVALTHRPDRLVDVQPTTSVPGARQATPAEILQGAQARSARTIFVISVTSSE